MIRTALMLAVCLCLGGATQAHAQVEDRFRPEDVFALERAVDPQIAPDGSRVAYVRSGFDILTDRPTASLWIVRADGTDHRALVSGDGSVTQPRWSPDGQRLAYVRSHNGTAQVFVRWMDTGQEAQLTDLTESPSGLSWSPDGRWLAFAMLVPEDAEGARAEMPRAPDGADWGPAIKVVDQLNYRADGRGYLERGHRQLFVLPADGGTPRVLTSGPFDHGGPIGWTPDGAALVFSANRHPNGEMEPLDSEIYEVSVAGGTVRALTDRRGPDRDPAISPDGRMIAYTGFDDRYHGYQVSRLYVMNRDGSGTRLITGSLDRDVENPEWSADGKGMYFQYDDEGSTRLAYVTLDGTIERLAEHVGGLSLGRPYGGGQFSIARSGAFAFTTGTVHRPADVAVGRRGRAPTVLTALNDDLLGHKNLGAVEEIWWESSFDGRRVQGWVVTPPGFDPQREYPLVLEIHGGPFANYGDRFAAELQLYAAAGYVVLYANPRGSTSYGEEFGDLIHHNYPGQDYDDLMSGVDALLARGFVDEQNLFVTGGSGGGVLSAWIVGKTDRFRAAVVQKPVINWYSFVLYSDGPAFFYKYWFPGPPWEHEAHYMARSPISLVGNVTTPTMLITGEVDYRTPMAETEQYYTALKIRGIDAAMVRVPDAGHGIADRPSNLIAKVGYVLGWFGRYRTGARGVS
ncbi:MAG: S9 family peptidase [Gemmatimonadales bacterium]|nr:S9 family peptidase [Gemmatimonadales bacterium]